MTKLIMGAALGYRTNLLEPFIFSLRRHYQGNVVILTNPLSKEELAFFEKYNIFTYELDEPLKNPKDIQVQRYFYYKDCLSNFDQLDRILICDVRDVMFQDDPFKGSEGWPLEFFEEPCLFRNCTANAPWIAGIYGNEGLEIVKDKYVICSGTTMGSQQGISKYLDVMTNEINRIWATGRPLFQGEDQPIHNYLIYTNSFNSYNFYSNGRGPITTVHHQQQLTFNRKGQLLNEDGTPTPVIHQWDRADALVKVLEKTALEGPLR